MSDAEVEPVLNLFLLSVNKLRDLNHLMILSVPATCGKQLSSFSEPAISLLVFPTEKIAG